MHAGVEITRPGCPWLVLPRLATSRQTTDQMRKMAFEGGHVFVPRPDWDPIIQTSQSSMYSP